MAKKKKDEVKNNPKSIYDQLIKLDTGYKNIMVDNDNEEEMTIYRYPLKSIVLNDIYDGGFPALMHEYYGNESSGKSLLYTLIAIDLQQQGYTIVWVDAEATFDATFVRKIGLDTSKEKFILIQPVNGEEIFDLIEKICTNKMNVPLIVVDSTNSLPSTSEVEGDFGNANMGNQAKMFSQACKKIVRPLRKNKTALGLISQSRESMSLYKSQVIGVGKALAFYASVRSRISKNKDDLDMVKLEGFAGKEELKGFYINITNIKNKSGMPYKTGRIKFNYWEGIDYYDELVDYAVGYGIWSRGGAWYTLNDNSQEVKVQGRDNVVKWYKDNEEYFNKHREYILDMVCNKNRDNELINELKEKEDIIESEENDSKIVISEEVKS
jgi:recombination protein RecA